MIVRRNGGVQKFVNAAGHAGLSGAGRGGYKAVHGYVVPLRIVEDGQLLSVKVLFVRANAQIANGCGVSCGFGCALHAVFSPFCMFYIKTIKPIFII